MKEDASLKLMELTLSACKTKISDLTDEIKVKEQSQDAETIKQTDRDEEAEFNRMTKIKDKKLAKFSAQETEACVTGDGNCFYRCLSVYLYGDETKHERVRKDIVNFMSLNAEKFQEFADEPIGMHLLRQTYTDGRTESWATEAEIMAASALYGVNIKVKAKYQGRYVCHAHVFRIGGDFDSSIPYNESIKLIYKSNHYNILLQKLSRMTACMPKASLGDRPFPREVF